MAAYTHPVKALLVGINYPSTEYTLRGCINDVERVRDFLRTSYGLTQVTVMTDLNMKESPMYPSRANILAQLGQLVDSIEDDEAGFFDFSGHGLLMSGGESVLLPADALKSTTGSGTSRVRALAHTDIHMENKISHSDLWPILSRLRPRASLFVLIDACHSGGLVVEMPYNMELGDVCSIRSSDAGNNGSTTGTLVVLSACATNEQSADTSVDGRPTGALTFAFCETLKKMPRPTYAALVKAIRAFMEQNLPAGFRQTPQISFNTPRDYCMRTFHIGSEVRPRSITVSPLRDTEGTFWS